MYDLTLAITNIVNADMSSNLINTPTRVQRGLVVAPWQFSLFKELSNGNSTISVEGLIASYEKVMNANGLFVSPRLWILERLRKVSLSSGYLFIESDSITYRAFNESLRWFIKNREDKNIEQSNSSRRCSLDWNQYMLIIITTCLDITAIAFIMTLKMPLPFWLIVARVSAITILTNIAYILLPLTSIFDIIPDKFLAKCIPVEHSGYFHKIFGYKILCASALHVVAHVCQIKLAIDKCVDGCSQKSILIVPKKDTQTIISYGYFVKQYPYWTGKLLSLIFITIAISMVLHHRGYMRYSTNLLVHKYFATVGFILTILHGCSNLLGFNYSFVFTLPLLLIYLWKRRHEIIRVSIKINRWVITQDTVRLYLQDDAKLDKILSSYENVSIYVNYPQMSKVEWHPFTLSRGYQSTDSILTMRRVGNWTNGLSNILLNSTLSSDKLNIGAYSRSKFRFHRLYNTRYFFCSGIGITAFVSSMADMIRSPMGGYVKTVLIWSIDSIGIINEFNAQLIDLTSTIRGLKIQIYYSNRLKRIKIPSKEDLLRFSYLQSVVYGSSNVDILTGMKSVACCKIQRADFTKILKKATIDANSNSSIHEIGLFVCGSDMYVRSFIDSLREVENYERTNRFKLWYESV